MSDNPNNPDEPAWLNPANDVPNYRYTDEDIELFVDGFIEGHPLHYRILLENDGPNTARIILRNRFRAKARDQNRL